MVHLPAGITCADAKSVLGVETLAVSGRPVPDTDTFDNGDIIFATRLLKGGMDEKVD